MSKKNKKQAITAAQLETLGVFVQAKHYRYVVPLGAKWGTKHKLQQKKRHEKFEDVRSTGGVTEVYFKLNKSSSRKGEPLQAFPSIGIKVHCSKKDIYNKNLGTQIAVNMMLDKLFGEEKTNIELVKKDVKRRVENLFKNIGIENPYEGIEVKSFTELEEIELKWKGI